MATIFGGHAAGLDHVVQGSLSSHSSLAVPTMFGATLLKGYKLYKELGMGVSKRTGRRSSSGMS